MEFKGTKGEWVKNNTGSEVETLAGDRICTLIQGIKTSNEQKANAKLIAAAPDLLSNLIRCVDRLDENGLGQMYAVKRAKEAINKALN